MMVSNTAVKDKEYYRRIWDRYWGECLKRAERELKEELGTGTATMDDITDEATEIFEETADAEQIAGYYIEYHKEDALKDWKTNTEGTAFSEKDKEINRILESLYR